MSNIILNMREYNDPMVTSTAIEYHIGPILRSSIRDNYEVLLLLYRLNNSNTYRYVYNRDYRNGSIMYQVIDYR